MWLTSFNKPYLNKMSSTDYPNEEEISFSFY